MELCHETHIFFVLMMIQDHHFFTSEHRNYRSHDQGLEKSEHGTAHKNVPACGAQNVFVIEHESASQKIKKEIVPQLTCGEIFSAVVNDMIRANGSHHVQFTGVVYARDVGAEHFG